MRKAQLLEDFKAWQVRGGQITPHAIAGRFVELWEQQLGGLLAYKPEVSYAADVRSAAVLLDAEGELAVWCVDALFFHPDLAWCKQRTWKFLLDQRLRTRHVRGPAFDMMNRMNKSPAPTQLGKVHVPEGR